ncbi:MAG: ATP-binding protein, partial [Eubacteriales bacterium]|nr:ATP-binding protein [Eubacteriales bacterium]
MTDNEKILSYINKGVESEVVDFKQIFYSSLKDSNIAKHVAAFANNSINEDKYIIFGVTDKTREICGIDPESIPDIAHIENYLSEKIEPYISISVSCLKIDEKEIAYLKIKKENLDRPYVIKNDCGMKNTIQRGDVYIRKGTYNSKALRTDLDKIYENN